jgi:two-component system sensor histidine kinase UhpB
MDPQQLHLTPADRRPAQAPWPPHRASPAPLDLPRLLMRRAGVVALVVLLLALTAGLARMAYDIADEVDAAVTLAALVARLGSLAQVDDADALDALRQLAVEHPPRHLLLRVQDATGRLLLAPPAAPPDGPVLGALLAAHRALLSAPDARHVSWTIDRPGAAPWTVTLAASPESERRESLLNLLGTLALLLACIAGLLLAMRWNLRRALAPLDRLLAAIAGIGGLAGAGSTGGCASSDPDAAAGPGVCNPWHPDVQPPGADAQSAQALPAMPIRELEAIAAALRRLGRALAQAETRRRLLSQQLLTLQEDERARLAAELHDEFGQRLTALRVDAAWLSRRLTDQPEAAQVVAGMAAVCQLIQQDIRSLLSRLQPFGPADDSGAGGQSLARLAPLLQALVAAWSPANANADTAMYCQIELSAQDEQGRIQPWPSAAIADALVLPQALALTLYRISQEALTNVARHAQARQVRLRLLCRGSQQPGAALQIDWSVDDDGIGLSAGDATRQRGNGLPGLRERVWAQGGELLIGLPDAGHGLRLAARFETVWLTTPQAPDPLAKGAAP